MRMVAREISLSAPGDSLMLAQVTPTCCSSLVMSSWEPNANPRGAQRHCRTGEGNGIVFETAICGYTWGWQTSKKAEENSWLNSGSQELTGSLIMKYSAYVLIIQLYQLNDRKICKWDSPILFTLYMYAHNQQNRRT